MIQIQLTYNITCLKKDLYLYEMLKLLKYISSQGGLIMKRISTDQSLTLIISL